MKAANIIQARSFKCIDNPTNTAVFLKYYAKGEKQVTYGIILPAEFVSRVKHDMNQFNADATYNRQMYIGVEENIYTVNYGIAKDMTYRRFFHHFMQWAKKIKPLESADFKEVVGKDGAKISLSELLKSSDQFKMKQFKVVA
jgi:hypothetical protein